MTEHPISGPMSMVKVDGSKIKHLRESQGLTQLYLATAVQVTTDTISRWENKKYPTIKKENGVKLAEALNVTLDDLLLVESSEEHAEPPGGAPGTVDSSPPKIDSGRIRPSVKLTIVLASLAVVTVLLVGAAWLYLTPASQSVIIAERDLPRHCIAGQPFPVLLRISGIAEDKPTTVIIKEDLPRGATVLRIAPDSSGGGAMKRDTIKWLRKINGPTTFAYVAILGGGNNQNFAFTGTAAVSGDSADPAPVGGSDSIVVAPYHWADTDQDNRISDSEILVVHDRYKDVEGLDIDIETIEAIWLGSGYTWNPKTKTFKIHE